ncbi:uncharacterized protein LOC142497840 isoform X5 [Ascaphus truei]|uniref:uncharacterized protein LOC142497840 isoform X5 n=1 Tax=Ascaphus truei TaxID=8439 RepID=UPI003F5A4C1B
MLHRALITLSLALVLPMMLLTSAGVTPPVNPVSIPDKIEGQDAAQGPHHTVTGIGAAYDVGDINSCAPNRSACRIRRSWTCRSLLGQPAIL